MRAVEPPRHTDRQALTGELIDHGQQAQAAAVLRACIYKVVAPDVILSLGPQANARPIVEPQSSTRFLLGRNFEPLAPPDALHTVFAHLPSGHLQQRRDTAIPIAAVLARQCHNRLRESIFVAALRGLIALRGAP